MASGEAPRVKSEREVQLHKQVLDLQAKLVCERNALPIILICSPSDPIGQAAEIAT